MALHVADVIRQVAFLGPSGWIDTISRRDPTQLERIEIIIATELAGKLAGIRDHVAAATTWEEIRDLVGEVARDFHALANIVSSSRVREEQSFVRFIVRILDKTIWFAGPEYHELSTHSRSVVLYDAYAARGLELPTPDFRRGKLAALLHDIGKIAIPPDILFKPGKFTPDEYRIVQWHPEIGYWLVGGVLWLQNVAEMIVRHHIKKPGGQGYPARFVGEDVPPATELLIAMEIYDALRSNGRVYRDESYSHEAAAAELVSEGVDPGVATVVSRITEQDVAQSIRLLLEPWEAHMFWPALQELVGSRFLPNPDGAALLPTEHELAKRRIELWFLLGGEGRVGDVALFVQQFRSSVVESVHGEVDLHEIERTLADPVQMTELIVLLHRMARIHAYHGNRGRGEPEGNQPYASLLRYLRESGQDRVAIMELLGRLRPSLSSDELSMRFPTWLIQQLFQPAWEVQVPEVDDRSLYARVGDLFASFSGGATWRVPPQ